MKAPRLRLGIIFNSSSTWMGGVIYILNVIKTLGNLEEEKKPEIYVFYNPELKRFVDEIDYPYIHFIEWNFPAVYKGYIKSWLSGKNVFVADILKHYSPDALFPVADFPIKTSTVTKLVSWTADLQHKYYPEFFTWRKIIERQARIILKLNNSKHLVVSSQAVKADFYRFYRIPKHLNFHIYRFVSIIDGLPDMPMEALRQKYGLPEGYFMISNQFHKHKNHKAAFLALAELKKQNKSVHFAITGRFPSQPDSPYLKELHDIINQNELNSHISFLGLIPRGEQLLLMKHAKAIVQPSLFEGWSTVIEDARSLQVPVIASDLAVNIEQLAEKGRYFPAHDYRALAILLHETPERTPGKLIYEPYEERMKEAANRFINIFTP